MLAQPLEREDVARVLRLVERDLRLGARVDERRVRLLRKRGAAGEVLDAVRAALALELVRLVLLAQLEDVGAQLGDVHVGLALAELELALALLRLGLLGEIARRAVHRDADDEAKEREEHAAEHVVLVAERPRLDDERAEERDEAHPHRHVREQVR